MDSLTTGCRTQEVGRGGTNAWTASDREAAKNVSCL